MLRLVVRDPRPGRRRARGERRGDRAGAGQLPRLPRDGAAREGRAVRGVRGRVRGARARCRTSRCCRTDGARTYRRPRKTRTLEPVAGTRRCPQPLPAGPHRAGCRSALVAGARSGDKGGSANVGVWARTDEAWRWLAHALTVDDSAQLLPETADLTVTRHVFPHLRAAQLRRRRAARRGRRRAGPFRSAGQGPRRMAAFAARGRYRRCWSRDCARTRRWTSTGADYAAHRAHHARAGSPNSTPSTPRRSRAAARSTSHGTASAASCSPANASSCCSTPTRPFLELSPLAAWGSDYPVGASLVTGIGVVEGVECLITANDPTVRGGASNPWTLKKALRANEIALANRLPLHQPRRVRRRRSAQPEGDLHPRRGALPRPHPALRGRNPHARRGVRQLHGRRRVRPRHVRPRHHGQGARRRSSSAGRRW